VRWTNGSGDAAVYPRWTAWFNRGGMDIPKPLLVPLSDADVGVRAGVAVAMASRMDRVSAPALLALVTQEEMLEPWRQSNVVQAINTLTGT
jgi:hypothetical protein